MALDLDALAFTPCNRLPHHLVFAENGSSVEWVMIGGATVFEQGQFTAIDAKAILAEIRDIVPAFLDAHARDEARNEVFHASFAEIHRRACEWPSCDDR